MRLDLQGRRVWITGAAGGLGIAMAVEYASRGARLVLTDIDVHALRRVAADHGLSDAVCLQQDVTDREQWARLADALEADGGLPTVLVNNAGVAAIGGVIELPLSAWERVIDVDLWGVIHGCRELVPRMLALDQTCAICNVASAAAYFGGPLSAPYFIAKAGVMRLTQSYQGEIDPGSIQFTVFCPGAVETGIGEASRTLAPDVQVTDRFHRWQNPRGRTPAYAARCAVNGVVRGKPVVNVFSEAWLIEGLTRLLPHRAMAWINRRVFLFYA